MPESTFIEELLLEAEEKEQRLTLAHYDLIIIEITKLQNHIEAIFKEAESEIEIINQWALVKNVKTKEKIDFMTKKLEAYIRETGEKTIDLAHGTLKIRKKPDKVEITDLDSFLKIATQKMLTVVPETVKPNLSGIKSVIKLSGRTPQGVTVIEGKEEFSLKIKEVSNDTKD